jgi:methyl-accepting chemotaxis protein
MVMSLNEIDAAELLRQLELGQEARSRADRASQAATSDTTRAQGVLDAVHDSARLLGHRSRELKGSAGAVRDSLERARLSALNAGLEGARLGEPVGKAVLTMADDVRTLLTRALDALEEHLSLFSELERERERWVDELSQSRELCASAVQRLRELGGLEAASSQIIGRLQTSLKHILGDQARRAELLAEASEQARALGTALGRLRELGESDPKTLAILLEPLSAHLGPSNGEP